MNANEAMIRRRQAVVARGVPMVTDVAVASSRGAVLVDADGREYIDFAGGIGVMNVGHCDPHVVEAIREQAGRLLHTCIHVATYEPYVALCEKLVELFPHGERTKAMLVNSGAEAVENAVKIARQHTGRGAVICYTEAFHGRTLLCSTMTSKVGYKIGCGPFAPDVYRLPFPSYYHDNDGLSPDAFVRRELKRLDEAMVNTVAPRDVAAIIIEVIQGEGGFIPAPPEYLRGLRRFCDEHGIVLIFDEVQSGFCRTGRWAAYDHAGVTPDLSTWAKSMGGGMPISCVIGRADVIDSAVPGTLGGTYGGNPVACAAALATIESMERMKLAERAARIGGMMMERFRALQRRVTAIGDVRGLGAMIGVEFVESGDPSRPATDLAKLIRRSCLERGLLLIGAGSHGNIIRVLCPLVITDEQLERALTIVEEETIRCWEASGAPRAVPAAT
jgi:4-aminobutyrate aminotransferase/(S)-3-amino-2-methylpropionate transaminase